VVLEKQCLVHHVHCVLCTKTHHVFYKTRLILIKFGICYPEYNLEQIIRIGQVF